MKWKDVQLGDVVEFFDYERIPLSTLERETRQGEYRYYGAQGVIDYIDDYIFDGEYVLVAEDGANLVTRNQPIAFLVNGKFWVNNHAHILKGKSGLTTNYYLKSLLNNISISGYVTGAAQPKLNQKNLKSVKVRVPSYSVQNKIASILSAYDDLIENNNRRIALLEESARQLYREWFVRLRFPGHENTRITDGVPEGWEKQPLGDLLTLQRGFDLPVKKRMAGAIPIYASTGVNGTHNVSKVSGPGVVTGRSGSLGKVMYVQEDFWPLNTTLWVKQFKKVSPLFATLLLESMQLDQYNGGAAVPTLNRNNIHRIEVLCPHGDVIREYDELSIPMYKQVQNLKNQNQKLKTARDLLLPKLMNGEIPV